MLGCQEPELKHKKVRQREVLQASYLGNRFKDTVDHNILQHCVLADIFFGLQTRDGNDATQNLEHLP
jgi:hypothetical protein